MGGREFLVDAVPAGAQAEISGLLLARSMHEVRIGSKRFSVNSRNARAGWAARSRFSRGLDRPTPSFGRDANVARNRRWGPRCPWSSA